MSTPTSPNRDSRGFREITVVKRGRPYRAIVVDKTEDQAMRGICEDGTFTSVQSFASALGFGITWIEGHHDYDSDEVRALLAANALKDEHERDGLDPFAPFSGPQVSPRPDSTLPEARYPVGMFGEDE